ncbi:hypothetical protein AWB71_01325 [Caballeronia peredens]|nr:hypothetical protein AWB71_01325 [Caballeronia peredens]
MTKTKPKLLNVYISKEDNKLEVRGAFRIAVTSLHLKIRDELVANGHCYLTSQEFLQVISLAWHPSEHKKALETILKFNLWLNSLSLIWYDIGYKMDENGDLIFGYRVESTRHQNPAVFDSHRFPRDVDAHIFHTDGTMPVTELDERIFALIHSTAQMWLNAWENRHKLKLPDVARGL